MVYNISYKSSVFRDFKKISKPEVKRIVDNLEKELSVKADSFPILKGKFAGLRKFRVGNYRIIYVLQEKEVLILRIAHRKDVYK